MNFRRNLIPDGRVMAQNAQHFAPPALKVHLPVL